MPCYNYYCSKCETIVEIRRSIKDHSKQKCTECKRTMEIQISSTFHVAQNYRAGPSMADRKEIEHTKKVKDIDRAVKGRRRAFGSEAVGTPVDKPDPKHIIKGKHLGGAEVEMDKSEFIKAAAKDPLTVQKAQEALKKRPRKH